MYVYRIIWPMTSSHALAGMTLAFYHKERDMGNRALI